MAPPAIDWSSIDTVFLDMDGTLLDLHFDNHFWLEHVPLRYSQARGIELAEAKELLYGKYRDREGTLEWYCVDHWSRDLGLDIALLKQEVEHLIAVHPHVLDFLVALAARGKRRVLVTNAHQRSIALKMQRTALAGQLDRLICAHDLAEPKESPDFWQRVQTIEPFDRARTLFVDDNERVLQTARDYGFRWLLAVLEPDSRRSARADSAFPAIRHFADLLPGLRAEENP
ncbi:haloacid dehalogenase superfamily protein, subfamily IA, variant 3 with third motif having DD or ED [Thioflavicoccus mobilis 8321]|uniref:Haloacid dehalogenase superfamily protein, subfamily IA, variant 3 with third motif having DD or ED n=1 Tax=Thioflavicoccus mobilis 8321 TaxID=765912 RepID=L0GYD6_9GAMM|nr:GMP/IMP nucleotidase [Thioflavicoccus mobilis]AGA90837.1 haloacid dehalogenase superfamily protein, subfamily IA, variant 3 with third motif having DD or ED [Thioflavicoccus mobilis 8321]